MEDNVNEQIDAINLNPSTPADTSAMTEEQVAYTEFLKAAKIYCEAVRDYKGSKKQVQRVMVNSMLSPLNEKPLHFGYPEEQTVFDLYEVANGAKLVLMVYGLERSGAVKVLKPLYEAMPKESDSEKQLKDMMENLDKVEEPKSEQQENK